MMNKDKIYVLGIETSCDETSASVVINGKEVLSNIVSSQIDLHKAFGGVVPEVASRKHIENISEVVHQALEKSNVTLKDIDVIAVTYAPGLEGALLTGLSYAKALSYANDIPLVGVHHLDGHISANYIGNDNFKPPFVSLIVSGGHTQLVYVKDFGEYELLGTTRDDACGETYDKVARTLGLPYPGGPKIDELSKYGNKAAYKFKRVMLEKDSLDFSFSGLKSNVLNFINQCKMKEEELNVNDVCASFQEAVIDVLVSKTMLALHIKKSTSLALAGGVSCNSRLRERLKKECSDKNIDLNIPNPVYCTDNAAMIAVAGYYLSIKGKYNDYYLNSKSNLPL